MDDITDIKCFCGSKANIDKQLTTKQFFRWRDILIKEYTEVCKFVDKLDQEDQTRLKKNLKDLPKCLVHFTRKVCNCDRVCVAEKFSITSFDHTCEYHDLENLYLDDTYRDCSFLKYKVVDGNIVMNNATISYYDLRDALYFDINKLCFDKNQLNALQCSAYDLRDECKDKKYCISFLMNKEVKKDCSNNEYREQLDFIYRIINFQEKYILKSRNTRSLDSNIESNPDLQFQNLSNSTMQNMLETGNRQTNYVILPPIISGIILSLMGYSILNTKNKEKKISICVFLLGGILFINSLYLALQ